MQKHESDSRTRLDAEQEKIVKQSGEDRWKDIYEMSWFQTGLVIDNGGGEVSALND